MFDYHKMRLRVFEYTSMLNNCMNKNKESELHKLAYSNVTLSMVVLISRFWCALLDEPFPATGAPVHSNTWWLVGCRRSRNEFSSIVPFHACGKLKVRFLFYLYCPHGFVGLTRVLIQNNWPKRVPLLHRLGSKILIFRCHCYGFPFLDEN